MDEEKDALEEARRPPPAPMMPLMSANCLLEEARRPPEAWDWSQIAWLTLSPFLGLGLGYLLGIVVFFAVEIISRIAGCDDTTRISARDFAFQFCRYSGGLIGVAIPIGFVIARVRAELRRKEELCLRAAREAGKELRKREEERKQREQEQLRRERERAERSRIEAQVASLAGHLSRAESNVIRAEREFSQKAYSSFWDQVELCVGELADYRNGCDALKHDSYFQQFQKMGMLGYEPSQQPKVILRITIPDGRPVAHRLLSVTRKAETNYRFASIYETRKTQRILIKGFRSVTAAVHAMESSISNTLSDFSSELLSTEDEQLRILDDIRERQKRRY